MQNQVQLKPLDSMPIITFYAAQQNYFRFFNVKFGFSLNLIAAQLMEAFKQKVALYTIHDETFCWLIIFILLATFR